MCLNVFAHITAFPKGHADVSEVVRRQDGDWANEFAWWTQDQFDAMLATLKRRKS